MRIAVIGTGGIGGPYGASLAQAGADVTFVARGAHLAAMRENGLRVEGDRGEIHIRPVQATDDIAGIGTMDFVLFCVNCGMWKASASGFARSSERRPRWFRYRTASTRPSG
jgi:2-dehydropantoate 2-reductase